MDAAPPERPRPTRRTLVLLFVPIVAVVIVGNIGNAIHPTLLADHPLWLVAMEPRNRYLLLVAEKVDYVPFLVIATVRRLVSDPFFYLLGYLYGEGGVRWMERKLGDDAGYVRAFERGFARAAPVMVFLIPGMIVCVLAGATQMSPVLFAVLNVLGTITVVTLLYQSGDFLSPITHPVNRFYANNGKLLTVISIALVLVWLWDQRRRGKSDYQSLSDFERELEGDGQEGPVGQDDEKTG